MNPNVEWTKSYLLRHEKGCFPVNISEHKGKQFYATIMYYEHKKGFNAFGDDDGLLDFKLKAFFGPSEELAMKSLTDWVGKELPGQSRLVER